MLNQTNFIDNVEINKDILITDKNFHTKSNLAILNTKKDLKYLLPIKRGDSIITNLKLNDSYDGILPIKENLL